MKGNRSKKLFKFLSLVLLRFINMYLCYVYLLPLVLISKITILNFSKLYNIGGRKDIGCMG